MTMPGVLTCIACNTDFANRFDLRSHHRSEWHRINLHRKLAGLEALIEDIFEFRRKAVRQEELRKLVVPRRYSCLGCEKHYFSRNALDQHLASKSHQIKFHRKLSKLPCLADINPFPSRKLPGPAETIPLPSRRPGKQDDVERDDELLRLSLDSAGSVNKYVVDHDAREMDAVFDASCCLICDAKHRTLKSCMVHMHKQHGFFIPDVEYLTNVRGFLTYLGLKVKRDLRCLYCNERRHPFRSLEAVRKHMIDKGHCRVCYGDGDDEEEDGALEEFYDYSSSYEGAEENELRIVELGPGGSELIITRKSEKGISVRTLGSRQFLRYYGQKPRPPTSRNLALASRYRSMAHSKKQMTQRGENRVGVEAKRSLKIGMKKNVHRKLPKNGASSLYLV